VPARCVFQAHSHTCQSPTPAQCPRPPHTHAGQIDYFTNFAGAMQAMPTMSLAYTCHMSTPSLFNELERPTRGRLITVYICAIVSRRLGVGVGSPGPS